MTTYRFLSTDLITGALLCDDLPLNVQSAAMQLNGGGTLTAQLDLDQLPQVNAPFVTALAARRAVLWVLADGYPVWAGVVWDWPDMSRQEGTLPVSAQTLDTIWSHRLITDTIEYAQVDLFTAFIDLVTYGQTKHSSHISSVSPAATRQPGYLNIVASNGRVARLVVPTGPGALAGVPWTASYTYSDLTQISSAWQDMAASGNLVYSFVPGLTPAGDLAIFLQLAYDQPGVPLPSSGVVLSYPGNCLDYGYQVTGSQSGNYVWATAPPNGAQLQWQSQWPHGADTADLAAGYPLMETTVSWQGSFVTTQAQVDAFADGQVQLLTQGMTTPVINVGGGSYPAVQDIGLGDSVWFAATSPLHPPVTDASGIQRPGLQQELRITGWTLYPPGPQQSEYLQIETSAVVTAGNAAAVAVVAGTPAPGAQLQVTTAALPDATAGTAYSAALAASGGTGTGYTWTVAGGSLPSWASLSPSGVITGTPSAAGTSTFTVQVRDAGGDTATAALSITTGTGAALKVTTTSLPAATQGTAYTATLAATGGTGTGYTWSVSAGALPSWASLNASTGAITGTPSAAGTASFTVTVTDSGSNTASQPLSITVGSSAAVPVGPGGTWTLVFDDEFPGTSLNSNYWATPNGVSNSATVTNSAQVSVSGGYCNILHSGMINSAPALQGWGSNPPNGPQLAVGDCCEARINFPGPSGDACYNWPAWWVSGANWPANGEEDIFEGYNGTPSACNYHNSSGASNGPFPSGSWCNSEHTYTLVRGQTTIDCYWDGVLVRSLTRNDNGGPQSLMVFAAGDGSSGGPLNTSLPIKVKYVRMWTPG